MKANIEKGRTLLALSLCILSALALCMQFSEPELSNAARDSGILNMMENLRLSLDGTAVLSSFVAAALYFLWRHNRRESQRRYELLPICCFFIAVIWLMARGFEIDNTLQSLTSGWGQVFKSGVYLLGSAWFLTQLGIALDLFLEQETDIRTGSGRLLAFYRRHSFLCPFLILLLSCILPLALAYPGGMCADSWCQAGMYFQVVRPDWGLYEFTSHHPPAHTVYFSSIIALGKKLGSANLGLFAVMLLQAGMHSAVFAYALHTMRQLGAPRYLRVLSLLAVMFCPFYVTAYPAVIKDNVYSWAILLFVVEVIHMLRLGRDYWRSGRHMALLALGILGSMLMRNNGKYVIYPMVLLLLILFFIQYKKTGVLRRAALCLLLPVLAANLIQSGLMSHYDIEKGSIREALSMPIQQTARYVLERGDEVTAEEKAAIAAVLDYDNMARDYYPMESDPVKDAFNPSATTADVLNYLKTWFRMGLKHPMVYVKATVNQSYPLVYPFAECNQMANGTLSRYHLFAAETIGIHDVEVAPRLNNIRNEFNADLFYLPFTGLVCSIPVHVLVLMLLCCYALSRRRWCSLIPALPLLLSVGIVLLAPGISGTPRYAYPIVYSLPVVMAYYCSLVKKE
ncbi:MAG: DUF6020 family protein [Candidatus Limivicinus sp.]|nr:DUF6020 family protein [Candidatus Limivicinus sp.]